MLNTSIWERRKDLSGEGLITHQNSHPTYGSDNILHRRFSLSWPQADAGSPAGPRAQHRRRGIGAVAIAGAAVETPTAEPPNSSRQVT